MENIFTEENGLQRSGAQDLILVAEDNPDDVTLLRRAIAKAGIEGTIRVVSDGEQVLLYLEGKGAFADRKANPAPSLIILDLKMPRKSGFEVLEWLQEHPAYSVVPTVVMSASGLDEDVLKAYRLGANTYFVKPSTFEELLGTLKLLGEYWTKAKKVKSQKKSA